AHHTKYGFQRTSLAGDKLYNSNCIVWDLAWLYRYTNGGLTLTPGIGFEWNSENQYDYYFGVSRKESSRCGLRGYNPNYSW
ncbi:MipA/OmpV family protein, partial [Salmonella enterica]|uniref:MipA/OmpV family protein n=1 Tax=Salmonella enterica TaxID=28901 RepID=UPI00329759EE